MRRIAVAAIAVVGMLGSSLAADLSTPAMAPPVPMIAAYNWNGFYLGAHVGYGREDNSTATYNNAGVFLESTKHSRDGIFGGGQIGYNWQFAPTWLLGVEADISASGIKGTATGCSVTGCSSNVGKLDDFGTLRGRIGYVANNMLLYGTGGLAWSHSTSDRTVTCVVAGGGICPGGPSPSPLTGRVASVSGSQTGWAAGAGIEWAFLPNWTAKVDYLHLQFDNVSRNYSYAGFPTAFRHMNTDSGLDTVRIGVNYLFNSGPVVARY
jgi:outer membrane immunogenic protein